MSTATLSNLERVREHARARPEGTALRHFGPRGQETFRTWSALWRDILSATAHLSRAGVGPQDVVGLRIGHGAAHVVHSLATWAVGATLLPLDPALPAGQLQALRDSIPRLVVVGDDPLADVPAPWPVEGTASPTDTVGAGLSPRLARATGGSTGRPTVGIARNPAWVTRRGHLLADSYAGVDTDLADLSVAAGQVQLVTLPQHHAGFTCLHYGLALGQEIVLFDRFSAQDSAAAIAEFGVDFFRIVPTQMQMILQVRDLDESAFARISAVHHGAGPCPEQVKRDWISLVGERSLFETYTTAEALFHLAVRGDAWLAEPGLIGHPLPGRAVVLNESGSVCGPCEEGEIHLSSPTTALPYEQLGVPRTLRSWGEYVSVGDIGYLSDSGGLHLTGRTSGVLSVGGVNVNAARVERLLLGVDGIDDVVVVARPDPLLGHVVHAVVVLANDRRWDFAWFQRECRQLLATSEVPVSAEVRDSLHRNGSGKVARAEFT